MLNNFFNIFNKITSKKLRQLKINLKNLFNVLEQK